MTKQAEKAEKKKLEARKLKAETEQQEYETEQEKIRLARLRRETKKAKAFDPERHGVFNFCDQVSEGSCLIFADRLESWARLNPGKPITIYLSTPGGSVLSGFGLYDTIRSLSKRGHHVTTVVRGYAASFGAVLLQAGDVRLIGPESRVMIHEVSTMAWGKMHEIKDQVGFTKELNQRIFDLLAERSGKEDQNGADLYKWAKAKDRWLSATACLERGFADEIG